MWNQTQNIIPLKGFAVGNGATNWEFDVSPSLPATVYNFNMIPHSIWDFLTNNNCVFYFNNFYPHTGPAECETFMDKITNLLSGFNFYDLY